MWGRDGHFCVDSPDQSAAFDASEQTSIDDVIVIFFKPQ